MAKKAWRNVFIGRNPTTGRPYFRRGEVPVLEEGETPPPPENFPEGEVPIERESVQSGNKLESFVPPTFVARVSEELDKKSDEAPNRGSLLESEGKENE